MEKALVPAESCEAAEEGRELRNAWNVEVAECRHDHFRGDRCTGRVHGDAKVFHLSDWLDKGATMDAEKDH